jgi:hypothetical protein
MYILCICLGAGGLMHVVAPPLPMLPAEAVTPGWHSHSTCNLTGSPQHRPHLVVLPCAPVLGPTEQALVDGLGQGSAITQLL